MTEGINTGELATMNSFRDKVNTGESVNAGNSITEIDFQDWLKVINSENAETAFKSLGLGGVFSDLLQCENLDDLFKTLTLFGLQLHYDTGTFDITGNKGSATTVIPNAMNAKMTTGLIGAGG
jgi:hypothetical protein